MPKISIYDPFVDAFREVEIDHAKKLVENVESIKAQIAAAEAKAEGKE